MADNGSTDGAPEEAVERYPNVRLLRTGANLGYGTAVNRAVASRSTAGARSSSSSPTPTCSGARAASTCCWRPPQRWPRAGSLGPLIRDPDGSVYPSARHLPSLIRGGMHAVVGPLWKSNPWTAGYRQERTEPSERPVGWLSGSCLLLRRAAFDESSGFDERYFMYMEDVDLGDRLGKAGWQNVYVPSAEILHDKGHATGATRPATWRPTTPAPTLSWRIGIRSWWQAPLRWTIRAALRRARRVWWCRSSRDRRRAGERTAVDGQSGRGRRRRPGRRHGHPAAAADAVGAQADAADRGPAVPDRTCCRGSPRRASSTSCWARRTRPGCSRRSSATAPSSGLQIDYVVEDEPLGTGGGIANVAPKLRHDTALVFNGDVLSGADLGALLDSPSRTTTPTSPCTWCASAIRARSAACQPMPTVW